MVILVSGSFLLFIALMKEVVSGVENEWRQRREMGEMKGRSWKREQRNRLNAFFFLAHIFLEDDYVSLENIPFIQSVNI